MGECLKGKSSPRAENRTFYVFANTAFREMAAKETEFSVALTTGISKKCRLKSVHRFVPFYQVGGLNSVQI